MFAERLKELRKKQNLTQIEFAKTFNIANGTVGNWESGNREPDYATIKKISDFFNVSLDYLLGKTDFSAEENRRLCQNVTRLWRTIENPPNPENIIGITLPFQQIQKNEYQFTYEVLEQFASYFDVGIDTLLDPPDPAEAKESTEKDIQIYMGVRDLPDKDKDEILYLIQYKKRQTTPASPFQSSRTFTTADLDDSIERIAAFGGMEENDDEPLIT